MRFTLLHILAFILSFSQAFAGLPPTTLKGQDGAKGTVFNFQVPYNQATQTASVTALLETGNQNLLVNPSFEGSTFSTGWTNGGIDTIVAEATNITDGIKSTKITGNGSSGTSYYQDKTPTIQLSGSNLEYSIWAKSNSSGAYSICARNAGAIVGQCVVVSGDDTWHKYLINIAGPSSGSVGIMVRNNGTNGIIYVDDAYVGKARNIGQGTPPNEFTADISSSGVVTNESPQEWITGNFTESPTGIYTGTFSAFTAPPVCEIQILSSNAASRINTRTATSLVYSTFVTNTTTASSTPITLKCRKTGSDFVQNAVTAANWNFDWKTCPSISATWTTNSTTTCKYKRQGGDVYYDITTSVTGAPNAVALSYTLPVGIEIARMTGTTSSRLLISGGSILDAGNTEYIPLARYSNINTIDVNVSQAAATYTQIGSVNATTPMTFANGDYVNLKFQGPGIENGVSWTETWNALQLLGSVTSNAPNAERIERATVSITCSGSPCTQSTSSSNWATITRNSTGNYSVAYSNVWSIRPTCSIILGAASASVAMTPSYLSIPTTTGFQFISVTTANNLSDTVFDITCWGPR